MVGRLTGLKHPREDMAPWHGHALAHTSVYVEKAIGMTYTSRVDQAEIVSDTAATVFPLA